MINGNDILVLGQGFMGKKIQKYLGCRSTTQRIKGYKDIEQIITTYRPKIIINAIGFTGSQNIDDCEQNIDATLLANTFLPIMLAEAALRHGIQLVHISSGCIYNYDYDSQDPIEENNEPDFSGLFYSRTKTYSERALMSKMLGNKTLITRIRIPLDKEPHPKNVLDKLLKYKKVIDLPNSVTYIPDFLAALKHLIEVNAHGIYNVVNAGGLRYPELLDIYRKYKPDFNYEIVELKDVLKTPRTNLIMSTKKLTDSGFNVRDIHDVLQECVEGYIATGEQ